MQRKTVRFNVDIPRTVVRVPCVIERPQLRLVRGHRGEQVGLEGFLREAAYAVQSPHVIVLVVEEGVPAFADQGTGAEVVQVEKREDHLEYVVRYEGGDRGVHFSTVKIITQAGVT